LKVQLEIERKAAGHWMKEANREHNSLCVAVALRAKDDAEIAKLKADGDMREDEITRLIKQYDDREVYVDKLQAALRELQIEKQSAESERDYFQKEIETARLHYEVTAHEAD